MYPVRLTLILDKAERDALRVLAQREYRDPRQQAAVLIRDGLAQRGLLAAEATKATASSAVIQPAEQEPH
jgi:hypothetical protein